MDEAPERPAELEHPEMTLQITALIIERMGQRMAHPSLGREMDDPLDTGIAAGGGQRAGIGQVDAM